MIKCTFGENLLKPEQVFTQDLKDVLSYMTYAEKLGWKIADIRRLKREGKKEEANKLKMSLPYMMSSVLHTPYRAAENFESAEFMIFDIDKIEVEKVDQIKKQLKSDPLILFFYVSSSGKGIKIGVKFNKPIVDAEKYRENYRFYKKKFEKSYGHELDNTISCVSTSNLGYDENLYYNPESIGVKVFTPKKVEQPLYLMHNVEDQEVEKVRELCVRCSVELSYHDWIKAGAALSTLGHVGEDLFLTLSTGNGSKDTEEEIRRKYKRLQNLDEVKIGTFFHIMKDYGVV